MENTLLFVALTCQIEISSDTSSTRLAKGIRLRSKKLFYALTVSRTFSSLVGNLYVKRVQGDFYAA